MENKNGSKVLPSVSGLLRGLGGRIRNYVTSYVPDRSDAERTEDHTRLSGQVSEAAKGVLFGALTYLFASAPLFMSAAPLGCALMLASTRRVPYAYAGLATAALTGSAFQLPLFIVYTVVFLTRTLLSLWLTEPQKKTVWFNEPLLVRAGLAAAAGFAAGTIRITGGGFLYYDIFGTVFEIICAPAAVYLFNCALDKSKRFTLLFDAGVAAFLFAAIYSLQRFTIIGFSMSVIAAFIVTLYISREGGILRGGVSGLICGIACMPSFAPIFALAGIAAGMFWNISAAVAVIAATITGIAFGVYLDGFTALRTFAPDIIAAAVIFLPFVQLGLLPKITIFSRPVTTPDRAAGVAAVAERRHKRTVLKLEALSSALCSLSEIFYTLSDRLRRPGIYDIRQRINRVFGDKCAGCPKNSLCWNREYSSTLDVCDKLSRQLQHKGHVTHEDIPSFMLERCRNADRILAELNLIYADLLEKTVKSDKTEIFAMDYEAMAKLLEEATAENETEFEPDVELSELACEAVKYMNFSTSSVAVYGERKKCVIAGGVDLAGVKVSADELHTAFENLCGTPMSYPQFSIDNDYITMTLSATRRLNTETAFASDRKEDELINGDHIITFENREDFFYTLLSDGMGSGHEAALTSRICGIFLEKMLSAGNSKAVSLEMLNNFIRNKNMECFATVDLLEIDLLSGKAGFIKSGAAPSYIMRDGSLFKISSNTLPVGITREITAEEIKFELESGDVVIIVSDGIAQSFEDGIWLTELVCLDWDDNLDMMAKRILSEAKKHNKRSDDMTVGLVRVIGAL
jgi:stage II sporulation protein E